MTQDVIFRASEEAFENAIQQGMKDPENWMYMYSDVRKDYFKNIDTREYITFNYKKD